MTGRVLLKKFGIVNSNSIETPVRLVPYSNGNYNAFTNQYGVWNTPNGAGAKLTATRKFTAPTTGTYKIRATVDNRGSVYIDDIKIAGTPQNFQTTPTAVSVTLTAGEHILRFEVINDGGPGTLACTISDSTDTQVLWDTRTYAVVNEIVSSIYTMTPSFAGNVTAHIWGGGGGGGSADKGGSGGSGSPGLYKTLTFSFNEGDTIEVAIGAGGSEGISGRPQIGGVGGAGRLNVNSSAANSFNGGTGGNGPVSGAGGGGGGATVILVNSQLVLTAGGGGAGGGAGNGGKGKSASITVNAMGSSSGDYRGQDGQTRSSDGGTGGGGGGGYPGGLGGKSNIGDSGAEAGQTGGNYPAGLATRGEGSTYYDSSYGAAGSPSAKGQNGYAVLEIIPTVEYAVASSVKVAGAWRQVAKGYVKVSGTWQQIEASYVKKNGQWKRIVSAGDQSSIVETASNTNYGQIQRPYS